MTESVSGSSLLQARGNTTHSTSHEPSHHHHNHHHIRSHHRRLHQQLHQQPEKKEAHPAEEEDSSVVHIVQTVDVIQLIDGSGATVSLSTVPVPPPTNSAPPNGLSALPDQKVAAAASTIDDAAADPLYSLIPTTPTPSLESGSSASLSMSPSFPTVESYAKITSTPLPSGSASATFPSFSGVTNATSSTSSTITPTTQPLTSSSPSPTTSLLSNTTLSLKPILESNLTTSTLPNSSGTVLFNASFTTTLESSDYVTVSTVPSTVDSFSPHATPTSTSISTGPSPSPSPNSDDGGFVGAFGGSGSDDSTAGSGSSPLASPTPSDGAGSGSSGSGGSPTPPATVAGSVLGSVAGVAFLLVIALMLLRWKKRQIALKLGDSGTGARGLITGAGAGAGAGAAAGAAGGNGNGKGDPFADPPKTANSSMSQRRSIPFAIPAALANLTGGQKRYSDHTDFSGEGGEKGFQKVSGRKLPSVLHYGGDGYSEPGNRDTVMSDQSYYRDSQGAFGGPGMPRLALGSPMRPESGVPVFHAGPARKAQTEPGPYSPTNLEPPSRDPLGRSHPSQDGSNRTHGSGSASRFTEGI